MHEETAAAAAYIASLYSPALSDAFQEHLSGLLIARYRGHWHQDDPEKGSAYRCLAQVGSDRPESLVSLALEQSAQAGPVTSRIARWTVFCDPGCVSARLGDSQEMGSLQEVWGTLPTFSMANRVPEPSPSDLGSTVDNMLTQNASPSKRLSKAIQIVRPSSRQTQAPSTPGTMVAVIPPTPLTAKPSAAPMQQPSFAPAAAVPASVFDRSVTPTVADPFARPLSRASSSEDSSSDGGHSSDRVSEIGSVFSATSHESLFPQNFTALTGYKRSGMVSHHRHTSSVSTTASSASNGTSASSISRPTSAASGSIVQEHSNGKVGVLGGGVLLGIPQSAAPSGDDSSGTSANGHGQGSIVRRPRGRGRSRQRSAHFHAQQQQQAIMAGRWPHFSDAALAF